MPTIATLSHMYIETFGAWEACWLFLIGAAAVLYSTIFAATAANTRLIADALQVFGLRRYASDGERQQIVRALCAIVPVAWTTLYLLWGSPVTLVFAGAVAQGLMLPFLAVLALRLNYRHTTGRRTPAPSGAPGSGSPPPARSRWVRIKS